MFNILKKVFNILVRKYLFDTVINTFKLPSAILLVLANLIPILGIVFFQWNPYDILLLYWVENISIGIFNFLRIKNAKAEVPKSQIVSSEGEVKYSFGGKEYVFEVDKKVNESNSSSLNYSVFFLLHYGLFTFVHGIFLFSLVGDKSSFIAGAEYSGLIAFFIALLISHGYSYFTNYIGKKEYLLRDPVSQMMAPYGRVIIMHMTIILGFFVSSFLPNGVIILFISLKIFFDLIGHLRSHLNLNHKPL